MARAGVSEYHVFQAADRLKALGVNPTVEKVRRELGDTGSSTTINNHLRAWRERGAQQALSASDLSASLQSLLGEQAKSLLLALENEAEEKFRIQRDRYESQLQQQGVDLEAAKAQLKDTEQLVSGLQNSLKKRDEQLNGLQVRLSEAHDESQTLRENRASLQATVSHLHQQLQDLKEQLASGKKTHEKERAELSKSLEAVREKSAAEKQAQVIQAARLRDLEHQIPQMQADLKKANAESLRVRNESHASVQVAEEARQRAEAERQVFKQRLADRDLEVSALKRELTELRRDGRQRIDDLVSAVAVLGSKLGAGDDKAVQKKSQAKKTSRPQR